MNPDSDPPPEFVQALEAGTALPAAIVAQRNALVLTREQAADWLRQWAALDRIEAEKKRAFEEAKRAIAAERRRLEWERPAVRQFVLAEVCDIKKLRPKARKEAHFSYPVSRFDFAPTEVCAEVRRKPERLELVNLQEFLTYDVAHAHAYTRWTLRVSGSKAAIDAVSAFLPPELGTGYVTSEPNKALLVVEWRRDGVIPPGFAVVGGEEEFSVEVPEVSAEPAAVPRLVDSESEEGMA